MENLFYKWLIEAVLGLLLTGFGLSLFGQSVIVKARGAPLKKWFLSGTLSLLVFNAGLCMFGDAVKTRLIYEQTGGAQRPIDNLRNRRAPARAPSATAFPVLRKEEREHYGSHRYRNLYSRLSGDHAGTSAAAR